MNYFAFLFYILIILPILIGMTIANIIITIIINLTTVKDSQYFGYLDKNNTFANVNNSIWDSI